MFCISVLTRTCLGFVLLAGAVLGQETVKPAGTSLVVRYSLSTSSLTVGDTLTITRTVVNRTSAAVTGLYLSDNLPPVFSLVRQSAKVNGANISIRQTGPTASAAVTGYSYFTWLVDSPDPAALPQRAISPGDSLMLELKIICSVAGTFDLPLHSTVCFGNGSGIFATSPALIVTCIQPVDTTPPAAIRDLGDTMEYKEHRVVLRVWAPGCAHRRDDELAG